LWKTWAASFTLNPLGENAATAPFPSAFSKASESEFRGGNWKNPFRQFIVRTSGCCDWGARLATS
jgi:hypothetical protein